MQVALTSEKGAAVGSVTATDLDIGEGSRVYYSLEHDFFAINTDTGLITTRKALTTLVNDTNDLVFVELTVRAFSSETRVAQTSVVVEVNPHLAPSLAHYDTRVITIVSLVILVIMIVVIVVLIVCAVKRRQERRHDRRKKTHPRVDMPIRHHMAPQTQAHLSTCSQQKHLHNGHSRHQHASVRPLLRTQPMPVSAPTVHGDNAMVLDARNTEKRVTIRGADSGIHMLDTSMDNDSIASDLPSAVDYLKALGVHNLPDPRDSIAEEREREVRRVNTQSTDINDLVRAFEKNWKEKCVLQVYNQVQEVLRETGRPPSQPATHRRSLPVPIPQVVPPPSSAPSYEPLTQVFSEIRAAMNGTSLVRKPPQAKISEAPR